MPRRFLRLRDVIQRTGLGRSTIYERMAKNTFPQSIKLGVRTTVWLESEIDEWMAQMVAKARGDAWHDQAHL